MIRMNTITTKHFFLFKHIFHFFERKKPDCVTKFFFYEKHQIKSNQITERLSDTLINWIELIWKNERIILLIKKIKSYRQALLPLMFYLGWSFFKIKFKCNKKVSRHHVFMPQSFHEFIFWVGVLQVFQTFLWPRSSLANKYKQYVWFLVDHLFLFDLLSVFNYF
jgi:hypothetical protein